MPERHGSVLITSAGRRVQLVRFFQRALADLKFNGKVVTAEMNPEWSPARAICLGEAMDSLVHPGHASRI